jgi:hypothetical protein
MKDRWAWPWWLAACRDFGFPVAVAAYVLWQLDADLKELTRAVNLLTVEVAKLGARLAGW